MYYATATPHFIANTCDCTPERSPYTKRHAMGFYIDLFVYRKAAHDTSLRNLSCRFWLLAP